MMNNILDLISVHALINAGCLHYTRFTQASLYKIQGLFKDFLKTSLLFSRSENLYKILIYKLKYYFGNVGLLYLKY